MRALWLLDFRELDATGNEPSVVNRFTTFLPRNFSGNLHFSHQRSWNECDLANDGKQWVLFNKNSGNVTFLKKIKRTCSNRFRTWRLISSGVLSTKLKIPFIIRSNWWNDFQIQKFKGRKKTGKKSEHEVGPENWKSRRRQHTGCWWFLVAFCWEGENLFRPL